MLCSFWNTIYLLDRLQLPFSKQTVSRNQWPSYSFLLFLASSVILLADSINFMWSYHSSILFSIAFIYWKQVILQIFSISPTSKQYSFFLICFFYRKNFFLIYFCSFTYSYFRIITIFCTAFIFYFLYFDDYTKVFNYLLAID